MAEKNLQELLGTVQSPVELLRNAQVGPNVYPGVPAEYLKEPEQLTTGRGGRTIGYLARVCPEKGLDQLVDAALLLRQRPGFEDVRRNAAGYLGKSSHAWYAELERRIAGGPLAKGYTYRGEVDQGGKLALIDSADVLAVPTRYAESKGIYVIESLARGKPVVLPHHGAFPELVGLTGGGVTHPPGDARALADALAELLNDPGRRARLGRDGHAVVRERFLDTHMAAGMLDVYRGAMR